MNPYGVPDDIWTEIIEALNQLEPNKVVTISKEASEQLLRVVYEMEQQGEI